MKFRPEIKDVFYEKTILELPNTTHFEHQHVKQEVLKYNSND